MKHSDFEKGVEPLVLTVETERETEARWLAEVVELPGVVAHGSTEEEALACVRALALRVIADGLEEFLIPVGITKFRLAKEIGVSAQRIGEIVAGRRSITADTDLRLCRFFGLCKGYWLRAQVAHDTEVAEEALADELARIKPWSGTAA